jgi:hypothetical protein
MKPPMDARGVGQRDQSHTRDQERTPHGRARREPDAVRRLGTSKGVNFH